MEHSVFISHSSQNADLAGLVTVSVEESGYLCWVAPRNLRAGLSYADQIVSAIQKCPAFVLLLTEEAARSRHVRSEVELAFSADKAIIPLLANTVKPEGALLYYLKATHWITCGEQLSAVDLGPLLESVANAMGHAPIPALDERTDSIPSALPVETIKTIDLEYSQGTQTVYEIEGFEEIAPPFSNVSTGAVLVMPAGENRPRMVMDYGSGLAWLVGPDRNTSYADAAAWIEEMKKFADVWRWPTLEELITIYHQGESLRKIDPIFGVSGLSVWMEKPPTKEKAPLLGFDSGEREWWQMEYSIGNRALAVCPIDDLPI